MSTFEVVLSGERPDLEQEVRAALRGVWPEFIFHDPISAGHIERAGEYFPQFDLLVLEDGAVVAGGWGVLLRWDGSVESLPDGYDGALIASVEGHEAGIEPDTLCVMAAAVHPDRQRGGYAGRLLTALRERAAAAGIERVIVPVRPTLKTSYPLTTMAEFATWSRPDGLHLDPWIRTHQRLGASILGPAPRSMRIRGTVGEWEQWSAMAFPSSGDYVVPGALDLVRIDRGRDLGEYDESNLWMRHA